MRTNVYIKFNYSIYLACLTYNTLVVVLIKGDRHLSYVGINTANQKRNKKFNLLFEITLRKTCLIELIIEWID